MMAEKKLAVIINGRGGAGKDTLCQAAAGRWRVRSVSSIDPIKAIAAQNGWNGEKDLRSRRFLAQLKQVFSDYNDLPTRYCVKAWREFLEGDDDILFLHIREPEQIAHFQDVTGNGAVTLLIRRGDAGRYGNHADDDVEQYEYDYVFDNSAPLPVSKARFVTLTEKMMAERGV